MQQLRPLVAEALGTFALIFIGAGSVITSVAGGGIGLLGVAVAHGLVLAVAVTATMNISGGHINPAVSIGLLIAGKIDAVKAGSYIVAQLVGAVIGAVALNAVMPSMATQVAALGVPQLGPTITTGTGIAVEVILTFLLMSAVMGTAVSSEAPRVGGFAIGLTITFCILVGGPLTGAAMNPARAFGPALVGGHWVRHEVFWIGPIVGAALAALLWRYLLLPKEASD